MEPPISRTLGKYHGSTHSGRFFTSTLAKAIPLLALLVAGCGGRLNDLQDLKGHNYPQPTALPLSGSSIAPSGILGKLYNTPSPLDDATEENNDYSSQGNLRKSFSYEPFKRPRGEARYKPLIANINEKDEVFDKESSINLQNKTSRDKQINTSRGNAYHSTTVEKSKHKPDENLTTRSISGPNVDGQQPYRHWSTESTIIREEHPDGLYSYPYIMPTHSQKETDYSRRNLKKIYELSTTEGYGSGTTKSPKKLFEANIDYNQHDVIPATTYRPIPTKENGYSFLFSSNNHSRHETGDTNGNFRGSIKYIDTYGGSKQLDYEGNPEIGIVTTEKTPIVNIPRRTGQGYLPPRSSSLPSSTTNGLTYSFSNPPTAFGYSPNSYQIRIKQPAPFTSTPRSEETYSRGKTIYQPPQYYLQNAQTYMTANMGDPYMYYPETAQYVMVPNYGAYTFSYNAGDHQRSESRDPEGNVQGMYSFEGTDGETKQVTYEANSEKGFVAHGRHLPVQPTDLSRHEGIYHQSKPNQGSDPPPSHGTYFFSYNAGEHMRQEQKDEYGNVQGMYSYLTGDGERKTVKYRANPNEGFIATGDDIPNAQDGSYIVNYKIGAQPGYSPESIEQNQYQQKMFYR